MRVGRSARDDLIRDPELRLRYGRAGRARIEQHFRIEHTVDAASRASAEPPARHQKPNSGRCYRRPSEAGNQIAYLIDRWPDEDLPLLERELEEMKRRNVPIVPVVCELNSRTSA